MRESRSRDAESRRLAASDPPRRRLFERHPRRPIHRTLSPPFPVDPRLVAADAQATLASIANATAPITATASYSALRPDEAPTDAGGAVCAARWRFRACRTAAAAAAALTRDVSGCAPLCDAPDRVAARHGNAATYATFPQDFLPGAPRGAGAERSTRKGTREYSRASQVGPGGTEVEERVQSGNPAPAVARRRRLRPARRRAGRRGFGRGGARLCWLVGFAAVHDRRGEPHCDAVRR